MTSKRTVRYVDSGGLQIAYQVIGDGPLDIVMVFDWASNLDIARDSPLLDRFLRRVAEYGRVITFDMRGIGLSDPVDHLPPLEEWVDDVQAVLAAVGSQRAALVGHGQAGQLCMLFAAMYPDQTEALVTINGYARLSRAPDYPCGIPPEGAESLIALIRDRWGTGDVLGISNPSVVEGSPVAGWWARAERAAGSPRRAELKQRLAFDIDVRDVLPTITVPTLVMHTKHNAFVRLGHAHYLADHITGSRCLELSGGDHTPLASEDVDELMDALEKFLTGRRKAPATDRALMTVAFTDIVGSTEMAGDLGDRRWRSLLEQHESVGRREVERARGRLIKLTGDGLMAIFDGPARAVQCMRSIGDELEPLGLPIRAGVHTGEVEIIGDDIGGIAVHVAARIAALADAGEVLTSSTVRDLVVGSGIAFEDRGEHSLKGVPDPWRVFAAH